MIMYCKLFEEKFHGLLYSSHILGKTFAFLIMDNF